MVAIGNSPSLDTSDIAEVLLVEDEEISRRALATLLQAKGFITKTAASAEEALQLLTHGAHPRLALVDLDLPGMNGLQLIDELAHQQPAIPAVLITASSLERLEQMVGDSRLAYLRKPLDLGRLMKLLPKPVSHG